MADDGAVIVARARALIGVRFRPQGRSCEAGLDCIGLVAAALEAPAQDDYRLRGGSAARVAAGLRAAGMCPVEDIRRGDVLVLASGPGQLHLGVWSGEGLVHADARLRRVVERPGRPAWPVLSSWRRA